jgi:flavorubredoxin
MATELYNDGNHICLAFDSLVSGHGIQSNQFLIMDGRHSAIIDPGGDLTYTPLSMAVGRRVRLKELDYVLASHQDPDIIASLDSWLMYTRCKVVCSRLWARFLPHLVPAYQSGDIHERIVALPDEGGGIELGDSVIKAVPAHFLHSVGNFQFYDPVSRILFSGDMGASLVDDDPGAPVEDFDAHVPHMRGFHRRYMSSNRACRLWADMVRKLNPEMIVPQHGRPFRGAAVIGRFLDWIGDLQCGVDLLTPESYRVP